MTTTSLSSSNNNKNNFHNNPTPRIVSKKNHRHLTQQQQQHHDDRIRTRLLHKLGVKNDEKIKNIQVQETSRGSLLGDIIVTHEPLKFDSKIPNTKNDNDKNSGRNNKKQNNKNKNYNKNSNDNKSSLNLWDFILSWSSVSSSKPSTMPSPDYEHANDYSTTTENTSLLYSSSSSSEGIVKSCDNDATTTNDDNHSSNNDDSTTITTRTILQQQQQPPPPQRKRLSFHEQVDVVLIPTRNEYSKRIRDKLWSSPQDMLIQAQRNSIEFAAEGWDWRNTMEDEHMYRCLETNELIHPIHIELQRQHDEQDEKQELQDN